MMIRYLALLALTSLLVLGAAPPAKRRAPTEASALYLSRALRRARTIVQLRLLELRKAKLERVRSAIQRGIPIDEILNSNP